jgi:phosphatidate cytidylyltransferase
MLLPRVLTALVGIPILLWLVHSGGYAFGLFVAGICLLCCYEYALILRLGGRPVQAVPVVLVGGALAACAALGGPLPLALAAGIVLVALTELFSKTHSMDRAALTLFGALFAGWMPAHLALIRDLRPHGEAFVLLLFLTVWATDSAGYFGGRAFGKNALASEVSPKKTWEGAGAGMLAAVATALLVQRFALRDALTPLAAAGLGAGIGVVGQLSDLAESMIKRDAGVKDSGALLPGHGGVFDRFDSYILAAPALYYALSFR